MDPGGGGAGVRGLRGDQELERPSACFSHSLPPLKHPFQIDCQLFVISERRFEGPLTGAPEDLKAETPRRQIAPAQRDEVRRVEVEDWPISG